MTGAGMAPVFFLDCALPTRYKTIDAAVASEAVRLIIDGAPTVRGRTMPEKLAWLKRHGENLRRTLMLEPRGHSGMHGALLTEPSSPSAHAGLLMMHAGGFPAVSGEAAIAAVKIALDENLIHTSADELQIETPGALLTVRPLRLGGDANQPISRGAVTGLPGFVLAAAVPVRFGARTVPVDIAFGGETFAIVDGESAGVPLDWEHTPEMVRVAVKLNQTLDADVHGVVFTGPARQGGHLRSVTVTHDAVIRRSPGVTTTIAVMAVLEAMGILDDERPFVNESVTGAHLLGRVVERRMIDERPAIVPLIEGTVTTTGRHEFVVEDDVGYSADAT